MLQTIPARSGEPTVSYDGKYLHSAYDPYREAERFIAAQDFDGVEVCILVDPGLDYLSRAVTRVCPGVRCLALHCSDELRAVTQGRAAGEFYPSDRNSLHAFLGRHLHDAELTQTKIVEWEPSASAFGEAHSRLLNEVYGFFRERNASINTTGIFGRRWITQRFTSFLELNGLAAQKELFRPLIIAASGPSLDKVLPIIATYRNQFSLWAFSSALAPLASHGIEPDMIYHSDAGHYASQYLRSLRSSATQDAGAFPVLAAPLTAAVDHELCATLPRLTLVSENRMERFLTDSLSIPRLNVPSHGTVAGTAYYAASQLARNAVFFAGLDLAYLDIRAHASGHAFYPLLLSSSDRMRPLHTVYYERSPFAGESPPSRRGEWLQSFAMETYSRWFASRPPDERFFRIAPSGIELPPFRPVEIDNFEHYARSLTSGQTGVTETGRKNSGRLESGRKKTGRPDTSRPEPDVGGGKPADESASIPAPPLEERVTRARKFIETMGALTEGLAEKEDGEHAAVYLRSEPLLYEFSEECNVSALLRLLRNGSTHDAKELTESLYAMRKKLETILSSYGTD
jgi:hypothetical protein